MIGWSQIALGATVSGAVALVVLLPVARSRRWYVGLVGAGATTLGAAAWNAILRVTHGREFFTDAPIAVLPASWQDMVSGVFAVAAAACVLGVAVVPSAPARVVAGYASLCGLAAFLVDVYLY